MHKVIDDLNWRYATKKFDANKTLPTNTVEVIKESLRLTPTSYGLQPLKFLIIENDAIRNQLREASYNQNQVVDASLLIVICSNLDVASVDIENYMGNIRDTRELSPESTKGFESSLKMSVASLSSEEVKQWNSKQAYIALGQLLHTCATLHVDALPMEGFEADKYDQILKLESKNLTTTLVCPVGYRSQDDEAQHRKKVRKSISDIIEVIS